MKRLLLAALAASAFSAPAFAGICIVADPSGTPLNVRAQPYGPILGALHNGTPVFPVASTIARGEEWTRIVPANGKTGWVFRSYLECQP